MLALRLMAVYICRAIVVAGLSVYLAGCATTGQGVAADPLEPMNRAIFQFNDNLDRIVLKPVAQGYRAVLPDVVREAVGNVFSNIGEVFNVANNLLQGKPVETIESFMRFAINTVFGLGGTIDIASKTGLTAHKQDFGRTLGVWHIPAGPYLVLPLLGPSSVRDTVGSVVQFTVDPVGHLANVPTRNTVQGVRVVDGRASLLDTGNLLEQAAIDKYSFVRDAYLQRRRYLIDEGRSDNLDPYEDENQPPQ